MQVLIGRSRIPARPLAAALSALVHARARGAEPGRGVVRVVEANSLVRPGARADAVDLLAAHRATLLRRARRFSLCADDAEDALQRAMEILLTKSADVDRERLVAWMLTVVGREALALRRIRQRVLGGQAEPGRSAATPEPDTPDRLLCDGPGPLERLERREQVARAARLLRRLKPQERRALALQAQGYSYAEIQAITGWTYTKVNRCLAEGRARLRQLGALR